MRGPSGTAWTATLDRATALAPALFGLPVLAGLGISLFHLFETANPALGLSTAGTDAGALFLGQPLYQDPAVGYTGALYTPLLPALSALLDHVYFWEGWPLLLTIAASLAVVLLAARLAYRPGASGKLLAGVGVVEAVAVGGLTWWLVSNIRQNFLYQARQDELSWALALGGLALVPTALRGSLRLQALAIVLLSAAFWAKQTTLTAAAAAVIWICLACAIGAVEKARAARYLAALIGVNLAVLGLLNLTTSGWELYFTVELPRRQAQIYHGLFLRELGKDAIFAVAFAGGVWTLVAARAMRAGGLARLRRDGLIRELAAWFSRASTEAGLATLFVVFIGVTMVMATYFRRKQGAEDNQYIGLIWGVGLLGAVGYRIAGRFGPTRRLVGLLIASLFIGALVAHRWVAPHVPSLVPSVASWPQVPRRLMAYGKTNLVYHPVLTDLNIRSKRTVYPSLLNILDLLAAGQQPHYLVSALLQRRFAAVVPEPDLSSFEDYSWAYGKWEQNYLWKIDEVIRARYVSAPGLPANPTATDTGGPPGFLMRRPGPERASWMRSCFGPFHLGGVSFRIHAGGGFWCHSNAQGPFISLRGTPAPLSEIVTTAPLQSASGMLTVALPRSGGESDVGLATDGSLAWNLAIKSSRRGDSRIEVSQGDVRRTMALPGSAALRPLGAVEVAIRGSARGGFAVTVGLPNEAKLRLAFHAVDTRAVLRLAASRGSGAQYGFAGIGLR